MTVYQQAIQKLSDIDLSAAIARRQELLDDIATKTDAITKGEARATELREYQLQYDRYGPDPREAAQQLLAGNTRPVGVDDAIRECMAIQAGVVELRRDISFVEAELEFLIRSFDDVIAEAVGDITSALEVAIKDAVETLARAYATVSALFNVTRSTKLSNLQRILQDSVGAASESGMISTRRLIIEEAIIGFNDLPVVKFSKRSIPKEISIPVRTDDVGHTALAIQRENNMLRRVANETCSDCRPKFKLSPH